MKVSPKMVERAYRVLTAAGGTTVREDVRVALEAAIGGLPDVPVWVEPLARAWETRYAPGETVAPWALAVELRDRARGGR